MISYIPPPAYLIFYRPRRLLSFLFSLLPTQLIVKKFASASNTSLNPDLIPQFGRYLLDESFSGLGFRSAGSNLGSIYYRIVSRTGFDMGS